MGTPAGRLLSVTQQVEDGESLRLSRLEAMELAREIAQHNFIIGDDGDDIG